MSRIVESSADAIPHSSESFEPRLTYSIAPPNCTTSSERRRSIAAAHSARIGRLPIDALLVYDVQDEAARNESARPFAFTPKVDPLTYALDEIDAGGARLVVYRAVATESEASLRRWLERLRKRGGVPVLVGAPSRDVAISLSLSEAQAVCRENFHDLPFGGVVIPERHTATGGEDSRVLAKAKRGCRFFVSQTLWSASATKRFLGDLSNHAASEGVRVPRILFTLSPCGSGQTLDFLEWLGVDVPSRVKRDLATAPNMLTRSIELAVETYTEVRSYAESLGIEIGCNVESVSSRAVEIEASIELLHRVERLVPCSREGAPNSGTAFRSRENTL